MEPRIRNFSELKGDKYDDEGVSTVTSREQVSNLILLQPQKRKPNFHMVSSIFRFMLKDWWKKHTIDSNS